MDFTGREWLVTDIPSFEFRIPDSTAEYNIYLNLRNEVSYPNANIYFTYYLADSTGAVLQTKLTSQFLFDKKTGEPFGRSGLGDVYDHQFLLLEKRKFRYAGKFNLKVEQFMRTDTLRGVLSVGVRVEQVAR
ncbi:MAG: gliding motility lipoprotein GldH [Bacteroidia bacterium]|nr:gliding motility lipoprotein GldH [Bacteroidia bacterium]